MKIKTVYYTSNFEKHFKKLPVFVKRLAIEREPLFRKEPANPSLKAHKLTGKLKNYFSFSINYHYRVLFAFEDGQAVTFIDVGTHQVYK